ncbi:hypothetical protein HK405_014224 [Cladochytrium tenue]|nr:hypothetical protein HK405_014224 [Cladochytrium tenue]
MQFSWFAPTPFHATLMGLFFALYVIVEPLRIWFGYSGNLREKVPDLAACFLFTLFPQLFACSYFALIQPRLGSGLTAPFELGLNACAALLLLPHLPLCRAAAAAIVRSQAAAFFLLTLADDVAEDEDGDDAGGGWGNYVEGVGSPIGGGGGSVAAASGRSGVLAGAGASGAAAAGGSARRPASREGLARAA